MAAKFPFHDLLSFKDYVVFAQVCLPDRLPHYDWRSPEDQWTLGLAFKGLREGLQLAVREKGPLQIFTDCDRLVTRPMSSTLPVEDGRGSLSWEKVSELLSDVETE
jgi:hypothetical protein